MVGTKSGSFHVNSHPDIVKSRRIRYGRRPLHNGLTSQKRPEKSVAGDIFTGSTIVRSRAGMESGMKNEQSPRYVNGVLLFDQKLFFNVYLLIHLMQRCS